MKPVVIQLRALGTARAPARNAGPSTIVFHQATMDTKRRTSSSYAEIAAAKGRALVDTFSAHMTPDEVNVWFSKQLGRYPKAADVYAVAKEFFTLTAYRKASLALFSCLLVLMHSLKESNDPSHILIIPND